MPRPVVPPYALTAKRATPTPETRQQCGTCARVRAAALALANKIANQTAIASRIRDVIRGK